MKNIFLLTIFIISNNAIGCNFSGYPEIFGDDFFKDGTPENCVEMAYDNESLCDCANDQMRIFQIPKLNELSKDAKKAYLQKIVDQAEKSIFNISNEVLSLSNHPNFADDNELGTICSIKKFQTDIVCSSDSSVLSKSELSSVMNKSYEKFFNEISNKYQKELKTPAILSQKERSKNSCGIPEKEITKLNLQKSKADLILFSSMIRELNFHAQSLNENVIDQILNNASKNPDDINNLSTIYRSLISDPIMKHILTTPKYFKQLQDKDFSYESIALLIQNNDMNSEVKEQLQKKCDDVYRNLKEALCNPHKNFFPKDVNDYNSIITSRIEKDNVSDYAYASQEIELYCRTQGPFDLGQLNENLLATLPDDMKKIPNVSTSAIKVHNTNIKNKELLLCNEIKDIKLADLPTKIQEKGCNDKKLDQDCIYLKTAEALYKDKIEENPDMTFVQFFNNQEKQEKPKIVKAFLGEEVSETAEMAEAQTQSGTAGKNASAQMNGANSGMRNVAAQNKNGKENYRAPASQGQTGSTYPTYSPTTSEPASSVDENMQNLYNEVARRIRQGEEQEAEREKRKFNPFRKKDKTISDTVSQAISGSINNYDFSEFGQDEVAFEDNGMGNFYDTGSDSQYKEENPDQAQQKSYNRALANRNDAINSAASSRSIASYNGEDINDHLTIGNLDHDSSHPTIEVKDVNELEELLLTIAKGTFENKDQLMDLLSSNKGGFFYIKSKEDPNYIVKIKKDKKGNLKIAPYARAPRQDSGYQEFYKSVKTLIESSLENASKWVDRLKGTIEDNTYKRFVDDN